jgi:hypothetical protein
MDDELEVEERDADDYEAIMESAPIEVGGAGSAWGEWSETAVGSHHSWASSGRGYGGRASLLSISPRGSLGPRSSFSRRSSTPSKRHDEGDTRRDSNTSLLGIHLAQTKPASLRNCSSSPSLRRISGQSIGSSVDPTEAARLRHIAGMDLLRRRFSECVEVTMTSDEGAWSDHTSMARAALLHTPWTPGEDSEGEEESEIHTAPYVPTPDMSFRRPALLSNYPLPSAVREVEQLDTPSDRSGSISPTLFRRRLRGRAEDDTSISTPPPFSQPIAIRTGQHRKTLAGTLSEFQFPPRSVGVPVGAGPPRPSHNGATSAPFLSQRERFSCDPLSLEKRATGCFPLARPAPLGSSPLRSVSPMHTTRMVKIEQWREGQSVHGARRISEDRRMSIDSRRGSIVAERRMSIVHGSSGSRKQSLEARRLSLEASALSYSPRRSSILSSSVISRKSSLASFDRDPHPTTSSRKLSAEIRRGSCDSRSRSSEFRRRSVSRNGSFASRKSSVMSFGEYGYLAPQIVVDSAASAVTSPHVAGQPPLGTQPTLPPLKRPNAPTSIALPTCKWTDTSPVTTPSGASRFNPLESFLGTAPETSPSLTPATSSTPGTGSLWTPRSETNNMYFDQTTPKRTAGTVADRPRPLSSPKHLRFASTKGLLVLQNPQGEEREMPGLGDTIPALAPHAVINPVSMPAMEEGSRPIAARPKSFIARKAVPTLTVDELLGNPADQGLGGPAVTAGREREMFPRGAVDMFAANVATAPQPPRARRVKSAESVQLKAEPFHRPIARRQMTTFGEPTALSYDLLNMARRPTMDMVPKSSKSPIVTFSPEVDLVSPRPPVRRIGSNSSFTRFFHSRSKSASTMDTPAVPPKPPKSSLRPVSTDCSSSSGSEKALLDAKELLRRIGASPRTGGRKEGR